MYKKTHVNFFNVTFDQIYSNIFEFCDIYISKSIISAFNLNVKSKSKC